MENPVDLYRAMQPLTVLQHTCDDALMRFFMEFMSRQGSVYAFKPQSKKTREATAGLRFIYPKQVLDWYFTPKDKARLFLLAEQQSRVHLSKFPWSWQCAPVLAKRAHALSSLERVTGSAIGFRWLKTLPDVSVPEVLQLTTLSRLGQVVGVFLCLKLYLKEGIQPSVPEYLHWGLIDLWLRCLLQNCSAENVATQSQRDPLAIEFLCPRRVAYVHGEILAHAIYHEKAVDPSLQRIVDFYHFHLKPALGLLDAAWKSLIGASRSVDLLRPAWTHIPTVLDAPSTQAQHAAAHGVKAQWEWGFVQVWSLDRFRDVCHETGQWFVLARLRRLLEKLNDPAVWIFESTTALDLNLWLAKVFPDLFKHGLYLTTTLTLPLVHVGCEAAALVTNWSLLKSLSILSWTRYLESPVTEPLLSFVPHWYYIYTQTDDEIDERAELTRAIHILFWGREAALTVENASVIHHCWTHLLTFAPQHEQLYRFMLAVLYPPSMHWVDFQRMRAWLRAVKLQPDLDTLNAWCLELAQQWKQAGPMTTLKLQGATYVRLSEGLVASFFSQCLFQLRDASLLTELLHMWLVPPDELLSIKSHWPYPQHLCAHQIVSRPRPLTGEVSPASCVHCERVRTPDNIEAKFQSPPVSMEDVVDQDIHRQRQELNSRWLKWLVHLEAQLRGPWPLAPGHADLEREWPVKPDVYLHEQVPLLRLDITAPLWSKDVLHYLCLATEMRDSDRPVDQTLYR